MSFKVAHHVIILNNFRFCLLLSNIHIVTPSTSLTYFAKNCIFSVSTFPIRQVAAKCVLCKDNKRLHTIFYYKFNNASPIMVCNLIFKKRNNFPICVFKLSSISHSWTSLQFSWHLISSCLNYSIMVYNFQKFYHILFTWSQKMARLMNCNFHNM